MHSKLQITLWHFVPPLIFPPPLPTGGGRKWKYLKPNDNGNVVALKMHVKKGDFVQVCGGGHIFWGRGGQE
jgi:hypothetical protein